MIAMTMEYRIQTKLDGAVPCKSEINKTRDEIAILADLQLVQQIVLIYIFVCAHFSGIHRGLQVKRIMHKTSYQIQGKRQA